MFEYLILSQFIGALITFIIGVSILLIIRKKTTQNVKEERPSGFWIKLVCLGTDLAIIDIIISFLAYRGSLTAAGQITVLTTLSYFFFFWLFFAATPAMMLIRTRILSQDSGRLKVWQVLVRLGMFLFIFVGWIPILFDKKEKKSLHDIVVKTWVVYVEKELKTDDKSIKRLKLFLLGLSVLLLLGLIIYGSHEKLTKYTESDQIKFFDLNRDGLIDGLTMDINKDGKVDVFKYDLNNDHIVDFTTFDTDKDGVAESIDVNNDGRVDGFDFDNDNIIDIPVSNGQLFIWLWKVLFWVLLTIFTAVLVYAIVKENNLFKSGSR